MGLFGGNKKSGPVDKAQMQKQQQAAAIAEQFQRGITQLRDFIAPSSLEYESGHFKIGTRWARTLYVYGFPREVFTGWLSPLINLDATMDISMFIYPVESRVVLENLRKKVGQLEASIQINTEKGRVRDPGLQAAISDAEELRDKLQVGEERFFRFGLYFTIYADDKEELEYLHRRIEGILGQELIYSKPATVQMEQGFNSTIPQGADQMQIRRNMNTGALSTSFPFTSADLSQEDGALYGINMHNNGLVIFDRFTLENANMVVFAKSGAGKSFTVKLEALRNLMLGTQIIIIDPENEYERMSDAVGGTYVRMSLSSKTHINPFDLPRNIDQEEADNALRANLITLHGLLRLMLNNTGQRGVASAPLTPQEQADLDMALINTYAQKGITNDPLTHQSEPPTITDLYNVLLQTGSTGPSLAQRLRKYTEGTFSGIFSHQSNVNLDNNFIVFNIRDLEDELRPVAMYIVISYIWNTVRADMRQRFLIVDEAWQLMQYEDSANFMFSIAKRARKYNLGVTTISQDVEDFLSSRMGRAVVANSSMQVLLKQAPSATDLVADTFKLTSEEKKRLTQFPVGQGLFFAGLNHIHIRIDASPTEAELITTDPKQLKALQQMADAAEDAGHSESLQNYAVPRPEDEESSQEDQPQEEIQNSFYAPLDNSRLPPSARGEEPEVPVADTRLLQTHDSSGQNAAMPGTQYGAPESNPAQTDQQNTQQGTPPNPRAASNMPVGDTGQVDNSLDPGQTQSLR